MPRLPATEQNLEMAGRIGRAWRELRRGSSASTLREAIYGPCENSDVTVEPGQMDALDLLVTVESCRMGDLAEHLRIDPSTATRAAQRLVKDELAQRVDHEGDGRVVELAATEKGRAVHAAVSERRRAVILAMMERFDESERSQLAEFLERFVAAADDVVAARTTTTAK
jgi:DNA-binding MarR family transcriptional regulator